MVKSLLSHMTPLMMGEIEWSQPYLEYIAIMNLEKSEHDQIIFMAGYTFALIDSKMIKGE